MYIGPSYAPNGHASFSCVLDGTDSLNVWKRTMGKGGVVIEIEREGVRLGDVYLSSADARKLAQTLNRLLKV